MRPPCAVPRLPRHACRSAWDARSVPRRASPVPWRHTFVGSCALPASRDSTSRSVHLSMYAGRRPGSAAAIVASGERIVTVPGRAPRSATSCSSGMATSESRGSIASSWPRSFLTTATACHRQPGPIRRRLPSGSRPMIAPPHEMADRGERLRDARIRERYERIRIRQHRDVHRLARRRDRSLERCANLTQSVRRADRSRVGRSRRSSRSQHLALSVPGQPRSPAWPGPPSPVHRLSHAVRFERQAPAADAGGARVAPRQGHCAHTARQRSARATAVSSPASGIDRSCA